MTNINLPDTVKYIITTLEKHGFEAFVVGGCVRDVIMGKEPVDWDICTSALPNQTKKIFRDYKIIETGIKHGTITLIANTIGTVSSDNLSQKTQFEITTYRSEGHYTDFRHPDNVRFSDEIKTDLLRRDFTINAIAYNPNVGIIDYMHGIDDIKKRIIRCVGNPNERFGEDALRILRALRFASVFNFDIEKETEKAIINNQKLLHYIAMERINIEISKLLLGDGAGRILNDYFSVWSQIIPEIFGQNSIHILQSVDFAPKNIYLRLALLCRDIDKKTAIQILHRLKYDTQTIKIVSELVSHHNATIYPDHQNIKSWLSKIGKERFKQLLEIKKADILIQTKTERDKMLSILDSILSILNEIFEQKQCFLLKDLAITGRDLIACGVPQGVEIGRILNKLLEMVIAGEIENDREQLLQAVFFT